MIQCTDAYVHHQASICYEGKFPGAIFDLVAFKFVDRDSYT